MEDLFRQYGSGFNRKLIPNVRYEFDGKKYSTVSDGSERPAITVETTLEKMLEMIEEYENLITM